MMFEFKENVGNMIRFILLWYNEMNSNINNYYSTIMSFYHIRSRERAKYEAVIHRSVLV